MAARKILRYEVKVADELVATADEVTIAVTIAGAYRAAAQSAVPHWLYGPLVVVTDTKTGAIL